MALKITFGITLEDSDSMEFHSRIVDRLRRMLKEAVDVDVDDEPTITCCEPVTKWRLCIGPAGHGGEHGNPWTPPGSVSGSV